MTWINRVSDYVAELTRLGPERFVAVYPTPMLLRRVNPDGSQATTALKPQPSFLTVGEHTTVTERVVLAPNSAATLQGTEDDLQLVCAAVKSRPGTPYPNTISVGRTDNNDIVIPYTNVSKLHAYFTRADDGTLALADAGSTNLTYLDGRALEPKKGAALGEQHTIIFAHYACEYMSAQVFCAWLKTLT